MPSIENSLNELLKPFLDAQGQLKADEPNKAELSKMEPKITLLLEDCISTYQTPEERKALYRNWARCCHPDKTKTNFEYQKELIVTAETMTKFNVLFDNQNSFFRWLEQANKSVSSRGHYYKWLQWLKEVVKSSNFKGLERFPKAVLYTLVLLPVIYLVASIGGSIWLGAAWALGYPLPGLLWKAAILFPTLSVLLAPALTAMKGTLLDKLRDWSVLTQLNDLPAFAQFRRSILLPLNHLVIKGFRQQPLKAAKALLVGTLAAAALALEELIYQSTKFALVSYFGLANLWFDFPQLLNFKAHGEALIKSLKGWSDLSFNYKKWFDFNTFKQVIANFLGACKARLKSVWEKRHPTQPLILRIEYHPQLAQAQAVQVNNLVPPAVIDTQQNHAAAPVITGKKADSEKSNPPILTQANNGPAQQPSTQPSAAAQPAQQEKASSAAPKRSRKRKGSGGTRKG